MNVSLNYFKTKIKGAYICSFQITGPGTYIYTANYKRVFMVIKSNLKNENLT
jgi:hypothetical protein